MLTSNCQRTFDGDFGMKRVSTVCLGLAFLALFVFMHGCATIYTAYTDPELDIYQTAHSKIALLPFDVTLEPSFKSNRVRRDRLEAQHESAISDMIWDGLSWHQTRNGYSVEILSPDERDRLFIEAIGKRPTHKLLTTLSTSDVCKILKADALIVGRVTLSRPFQIEPTHLARLMSFGKLDRALINMSIYECSENKLIWNYKHAAKVVQANTPRDAAELAIARAVHQFPYKQAP